MNEDKILVYGDLAGKGFSGTAWNVYCEFGAGDEWWGHDGERTDELDAWFEELGDAIAFADERYPDDVLEDKLLCSPDAGGAERLMLGIRSWVWEGGEALHDGDEEFFVLVEKDGGGGAAVSARRMP